MAALERRCPETHDHKCLAEQPCGEECELDGINWCPGMPNHGRPPRWIREARARRGAERRACAAGPPDVWSTGPQRLLLAMPLHAITATYGEQGLRERFAAEIAWMPEPVRAA